MISLEELKNVTTPEKLYSVGTKIIPDSQEIIEPFLKKKMDEFGYFGMYPMWLLPVINIVDNNFRYRYLLINIDKDIVAVFYKYVFVLKTKYIRLYLTPISKLGIKENETLVFSTIMENKLVRQIFDFTDDDTSKEFHDWNFFNLVKERWEKINKSSWRSTKHINAALRSNNFNVRVITRDEFDKVHQVYKLWETHKKIYKKINSSSKEISHFLEMTTKGIMQCVGLFYKDTLIAYAGFISCFGGKIIHQWYNTSVSAVTPEELATLYPDLNDELFPYTHRHLGAISHYFFTKYLNELGVEALYMGGTGDGTEKFLAEHKREITSYAIKYKQYSIKDVSYGNY